MTNHSTYPTNENSLSFNKILQVGFRFVMFYKLSIEKFLFCIAKYMGTIVLNSFKKIRPPKAVYKKTPALRDRGFKCQIIK